MESLVSLSSLKEYFDHSCGFGMGFDASTIILNLSSSRIAFAIVHVIYFEDKAVFNIYSLESAKKRMRPYQNYDITSKLVN